MQVGREGDDRGWDGWMASPTPWTCVGWTLGVGDGQGGLACCGSWGHKELDTTERLNWLTWRRDRRELASLHSPPGKPHQGSICTAEGPHQDVPERHLHLRSLSLQPHQDAPERHLHLRFLSLQPHQDAPERHLHLRSLTLQLREVGVYCLSGPACSTCQVAAAQLD